MTKSFHEVEVIETFAVRRRHLVLAEDMTAALDAAEKGCALLTTDITGQEVVTTLAARGAKALPGEPKRISLEHLLDVMGKPHAFTVHVRTWTEHGMSEPQEMMVHKVHVTGERGFEAGDFPGDRDVRFIREDEIAMLIVESEANESTYRVTDIVYDTDGETAILDLPETLDFDIDADLDGGDVDEALSDAISERTGWCVKGFSAERLDAGWHAHGADMTKITA